MFRTSLRSRSVARRYSRTPTGSSAMLPGLICSRQSCGSSLKGKWAWTTEAWLESGSFSYLRKCSTLTTVFLSILLCEYKTSVQPLFSDFFFTRLPKSNYYYYINILVLYFPFFLFIFMILENRNGIKCFSCVYFCSTKST